MSSTELRRLHVGPRLSEVSIHQGVVRLAGQIPERTASTGDLKAQATEVFECVDRLLKEAGSDRSRILFCQIFLSDITRIAEMNEVWDAWIPAGNTPPRATVEARLAKPEWLIEVCVEAAVG